MIPYSFKCPACGVFTEYHQSMQGQKKISFCPDCGLEASRTYQPPHVARMDGRVKKRLEKGMEPRVINRSEINGTPVRSSVSPSRPWQV
ncbi:hypothetical protein [Alkalicoccus saliphilus]|uniref:Uncharacterized protein n=1 Tax=Alkalicoccus saliphilus TaxID=200989 RepID=A0A2T4U2F6_9BACI|nr:hypothetical protein [Alkalicoccus saliphilus]PTL37578.1 hypothetical protein C6Y45_15860 [Alkalicoccus saliphilus]